MFEKIQTKLAARFLKDLLTDDIVKNASYLRTVLDKSESSIPLNPNRSSPFTSPGIIRA